MNLPKVGDTVKISIFGSDGIYKVTQIVGHYYYVKGTSSWCLHNDWFVTNPEHWEITKGSNELTSSTATMISLEETNTHEHEYRHYEGLFEKFDYCVVCDEKKYA